MNYIGCVGSSKRCKVIFRWASQWALTRARSLANRRALEKRALVFTVGEAVRHSCLLKTHIAAERGRVVRHFAGRDCAPINTGEKWMLLDFFNAAKTYPHGRLLGEKQLYEILGLRVNVGLGKLDLLALLDIVIGFKIRSALERCLTTQ